MSLPSRSGPSNVRTVTRTLAVMGCGNSIYTPGQVSTALPGRR